MTSFMWLSFFCESFRLNLYRNLYLISNSGISGGTRALISNISPALSTSPPLAYHSCGCAFKKRRTPAVLMTIPVVIMIAWENSSMVFVSWNCALPRYRAVMVSSIFMPATARAGNTASAWNPYFRSAALSLRLASSSVFFCRIWSPYVTKKVTQMSAAMAPTVFANMHIRVRGSTASSIQLMSPGLAARVTWILQAGVPPIGNSGSRSPPRMPSLVQSRSAASR
mmetsp:Transcript_103948/g.318440  ORF Transcript_103948/g.318440 Transcript_103948/m.318440 type:complete len:225 (-) Transcript_103948:1366-2040(-)